MQNAPTVDSPENPQGELTLAERRRPGRLVVNSPALIQLLRHPTAAPPITDPIDAAGRPAPPHAPLHQDERCFAITNFDTLRPRPGDSRGASRPVAPPAQAIEFAVARAGQFAAMIATIANGPSFLPPRSKRSAALSPAKTTLRAFRPGIRSMR